MIPATSRSRVVLPDPLRPMSPTASPFHLERDVVERPDFDCLGARPRWTKDP